MVTVWSEAQPGRPLTDCVYSAGLMALDFAGWNRWPNGHHTIAERNALERSQTMFARNAGSNFAALDQATKKRFGVALRLVSGGLAEALSRPGTVLALGGVNGRLEPGDRWRRWDPTFTDFHAVAVIPLGDGTCRVLDPLAPMGFVGDVVPNSKVLTWANGPSAADARLARAGEFASAAGNVPREEDTVTEVTISVFAEGPRTCFIPAGGRVEGWTLDGLKVSKVWPDGSNFPADAGVFIRQRPQKAPNGTFLRCTAGTYVGSYVPVTHVRLGPPVNPPADCSALEAELAAARAELAAERDRFEAGIKE
ncbi:MAG TPA: hypothetical protein VGO32_07900 [Candidatus Limnocylindria bacterium]|nr:hypothetical protein [Candidatus Limnocylindria bacterium]